MTIMPQAVSLPMEHPLRALEAGTALAISDLNSDGREKLASVSRVRQ